MRSLERVLIVGATSAIATQAARQLVGRGASLYCIGRDESRLNTLLEDLRVRGDRSQIIAGAAADLLDFDRHQSLIDQADEALGGLDAVLIAYGTLPDQKACEASFTDTRREIDVNAISVISLLTLLANRFEQQKTGVIAVISSVAGDRGRQSNYVYGAAKGMVTLFLQGLRNRLTHSGVAVVTLKPGFVDTPMTDSFDKSGLMWASPDQVARGIVAAMASGKAEVYLPGFWRWIMLVIRNIPEAIFRRMSL
jgi:hypothetical protein